MFEQFRDRFPLEDRKWEEYTARFTRMQVPAKTILLREGDVPKKLFLIEKGCVRGWFNNHGKDVTCQFFFENNSVASIESFKKGLPSPVSLETIEAAVLWYVHKKDAELIFAEVNELPAMRDKITDFLFERTFDYMKYFMSFIKDTPQQRYLNLVKERPMIIQRVPQHYIASYLGISPVHLSRIKSRLASEKRST